MKTFQAVALVFAVLAACANAFAPAQVTSRPTFKPASALAMSKSTEPAPVRAEDQKNAAAVAAFVTAMAPLAAHADELSASGVDEGTIIGYGAGLVACVVSLAVGFSIGYGTLVKP